jgi:hypothetical protein
MAGFVGVIWVSREALYFCADDWTGQISLKSLNKIARTRSASLAPIDRRQAASASSPGEN